MVAFFMMLGMSKLPILISISCFSLLLSLVSVFNAFGVFWFSLLFFVFEILVWSRDLFREMLLSGGVSMPDKGKMMMLLFITSEVFFFFSFFWAYFNNMTSVDMVVGLGQMPTGVVGVFSFMLPFLNTLLLLSSSFFFTMFHMKLMTGSVLIYYYVFGLFFGVYFLFIQWFEYCSTFFSLMDSVFGSCFFVATGFHGSHVLGGGLSLLLMMNIKNIFNVFNFLVLELVVWYWHFVDVVWLFLFSFMYWWLM